ncbi:hypothetical protein [Cylindrospermopsis raciborskii]|jgi:hypothetical protein|uniref:hypothetical protein n=1 Tax=Cylindrospermopsis raciborskii TaxID=77022 RepID=UPI000B621E72|nr:hypothetical protein [Cylindrospermopsis raciborskii]UJL35048.1 hypothetical protein C6N34_007810 [Cylindrospermopsis raciborskii Cr2010]UJS04589.1 hypothetical protein L3I90_16240 [Cylindrospermopsis raciborskii KLL07]BAZ91177.1 hypothetical protein NIES932_26840 [Raphidiopsis curvata NIES-932]
MAHLLLPQLKDDCDVKSGTAGVWDAQAPTTFDQVGTSLDYAAPGEIKNISSVPTIWARPLSVEMALHNDKYPIREQIIVQWQGMLTVLALAEVRAFPIKAQPLELGARKDKNLFARSLYELLPDDRNSIYQLNNNKNPWEDLYIFTWNNNPVGMTSPSTLVVPSEEGIWDGLPWWNPIKMGFEPVHGYLNSTEKAQLVFWLNNLKEEIGRANDGERDNTKKAVNIIFGLINDFIRSLGVTSGLDFQLTNNQTFFDVSLNKGALWGLNFPVKVQPRESNIRVVPSINKPHVKPLLIIDRDIANSWNEPSQNIWVHEGKTLAALRPEDIEKWNKSREVICVKSQELFLPELKFIDQGGILPNALLPEGAQSLTFKSAPITPLIPINPILLDYFTPEYLSSKIVGFQINRNGGGTSLVKVTLTIPLYGIKEGRTPQNFYVYKEYPLLEENIISEVPVLEIWPNFQVQGWKEYYGFYYDAGLGEETFQVSFPTAEKTHSFSEKNEIYQVAKLNEFPSFLKCKDNYKNTIGLILLPTPQPINLGGQWVVGVDFGTSFTNVYVNKNDRLVERLDLENLHCQVTDVSIDTRFPALFEFFIPENFIPEDKPFPLSTVLTTKGKTNAGEDQVSPILDGRIYIPDLQSFDPEQPWIKTNLKWTTTNLTANELFLKHLALHITALAAKNGVREIQWSLSFPSAFSSTEQNRYIKRWSLLTGALVDTTGIIHKTPTRDDPNYFKTESLAVGQYFAEQEGYDLVGSTCIDMGGGTSDISIWQDDQLLDQCSILLAGRELFSQFIEMNPDFLKKLDPNIKDIKGKLKGAAFYAKLDVWMRLESANWLEKKRDRFEEDREFQGLIRLMAIGISGLYFYIGQILSVLSQEQKYSRDEITSVYIGGNGSRLLHWLAEGGEFNRHSEINALFNKMMSIAAKLPQTDQPTLLSQNPKDEAACGLVLRERRLRGLGRNDRDPIIAGEDCIINGQTFDYHDRLNFRSDISTYQISFNQLKLFLNSFHTSLDELRIEGVKPLETYQVKENLDDPDPDYNAKLWRATERELRNDLNSIRGSIEDIRQEPPFIMALKALLRVLGKEWAGK